MSTLALTEGEVSRWEAENCTGARNEKGAVYASELLRARRRITG